MKDIYILSNEKITIKVNKMGAELSALIKNDTRCNYLWDANPEYWKRYSPVLFPIVGSLKNKEYSYKGITYSMSQHGFARDSEFELLHQKEDEIWLRLTSNEETKKMYPFDFILEIGYKIEGTKVMVMWKVKNTGEDRMYFSIGAHPAFLCPINDSDKQTDYFIDFHKTEPISYRNINESGLVKEKEHSFNTNNGLLGITSDLFDDDALIIENHQTQKISLVDGNRKPYLTVNFDAPLFGLWSPAKKNAPFVCIEPWYGRCDSVDFDGTFGDRMWTNKLNGNETFEASYTIKLED